VIDPFHIALVRMIEMEIVKRASDLGSGRASDYPAYREEVGIITGLNLVMMMGEQIENEKYGTPIKGTE